MKVEQNCLQMSNAARFGSRLQQHLRYRARVPGGEAVDALQPSADRGQIKMQKILDCTVHSFSGTGIGPDSSQIKRGVVGPLADQLADLAKGVLHHGGQVGATLFGVLGSCTVGLRRHYQRQSDGSPQSTAHWVAWARASTEARTHLLGGIAAEVISLGEELIRSVAAVLGGALLGLAWIYDRGTDALRTATPVPERDAKQPDSPRTSGLRAVPTRADTPRAWPLPLGAKKEAFSDALATDLNE